MEPMDDLVNLNFKKLPMICSRLVYVEILKVEISFSFDRSWSHCLGNIVNLVIFFFFRFSGRKLDSFANPFLVTW